MQTFNPETDASRLPIDKTISFEIRDRKFKVSMQVPFYILEKLNKDAANWDAILADLKTRVTTIVDTVAQLGLIGEWGYKAAAIDLETYARTRVYHQFKDVQTRTGNDAWAANLELEPNPEF